jgi:pimeloyl-ACP methyl ester carboxylesterase
MPLREVNGLRLLVEESGDGDPLVLVHGSWADRQGWALVEDALARSFRVTSYDRRGHTGSEDGPAGATRRDDEDDLAALVAAHGAPAHLVGNSFGACIALSLAARRPDLVRSVSGHEPPFLALVADDPVLAPVGASVGKVMALIEQGENEAAARTFVEEVALGPGAWELLPADDQTRAAANAPTFADEMRDPRGVVPDLDALAALDRPVLLTKGDQSPPFFAPIIARLADRVPQAQVKTLNGAGHLPHLTHPSEWVGVVTAFARDAG